MKTASLALLKYEKRPRSLRAKILERRSERIPLNIIRKKETKNPADTVEIFS